MKRRVITIIILILVIALLAGACWFFLAVRRDLTASVFSYWGDRFDEAGRYERAVSCYASAAKFAPENPRIPVVLAQTYAKTGNYTKAEFTLVNAITEKPDCAELYVTLSGIYIEQDKLLDAANMLERVTNEDVRSVLTALRPTAPVISPESGYYNEYIEVSATTQTGRIYLTADGTFPSLEKDAYTAPVAVEGGETNVTAISVAQNGLVSSVTYAGYTVGNVVEPVTLNDGVLDACVRELLSKLPGQQLMTDELWEIAELELPEGVKSLEELTLFTGLKSLTLHNAAGLDLSVIGQLTTLQKLDLSGCTLPASVLDCISQLPDLRSLSISGCAVESITPLAGLTALEYLDLSNNTVTDITVLSNMTQLQELHLTNNHVRTITYLNNCLKLKKLYAEGCSVAKLTSLAGNTCLEELYLSDNEIEDISVLSECSALRVLDVSANKITDISVLPQLPALVNFKADHNEIEAIPKFDPQTSELVQFNVNYNKVADVSGLKDLMKLNYVRADYNKIKDVTCLKNCYCLIQIDVWDNPIKTEGIEEMQEMGIIVNYNPTYEPPKEA